MELEFFVEPGSDEQWHEYWVEERVRWWTQQGVPRSAIELLVVPEDERAHYSKATTDLMYRFPHGTEELEGIANRSDFDLGSHSKGQDALDLSARVEDNDDSNTRLAVQDTATKKWVVPFVIEPSAGVDRGVLAVLNEAFRVEELENGNTRTVLALARHLAPIKVAIIPVKRNHEGIVAMARGLKQRLQRLGLGRVQYEHTGNIGKAYRRHDEVGTPICVTVDFDSIEGDGSVTIRDRDSMSQQRVASDGIETWVRSYFAEE